MTKGDSKVKRRILTPYSIEICQWRYFPYTSNSITLNLPRFEITYNFTVKIVNFTAFQFSKIKKDHSQFSKVTMNKGKTVNSRVWVYIFENASYSFLIEFDGFFFFFFRVKILKMKK